MLIALTSADAVAQKSESTSTQSINVKSRPDVDAMIAEAKTYLYSQQHNGNWELVPAQQAGDRPNDPKGSQWTGLTALSTYALLSSGEQQSDPRISAAIDFLKNTKTVGTYALGFRCLIWGSIELKPATRKIALRDRDLLLANMRSVGDAKGLFWYGPPTNADAGGYDISASQFGPLGLASLCRVGIEVPTAFWKISEEAFGRMQHSDGSWYYTKVADGSVHINMTAAGVASLLIAQECSSSSDSDDQVSNGIAWIGSKFETDFAARLPSYGLFAYSRIGAASGLKYFGDVDWYNRGLSFLADHQNANGSWVFTDEFASPADTALSALFLAYGSAPVVIDKLRYSITDVHGKPTPGNWNTSPSDALNFVQWMGSQVERRLNWQVVDLRRNNSRDFHDAPILWISGDQELNFSSDEKAKLKQFVDEGGLILGNAVSKSTAFSNSFQKLGQTLYGNYEFRELSDDHPMFRNDKTRRAKLHGRAAVLGLSNGVRELMLLPQQDLSKAFRHQFDPTQLSMYQLADDVVLYATESQGLQLKGKSYLVALDPRAAVGQYAKVIRLRYLGNWDPEPSGWSRIAAVMHNDCGVDVEVKTVGLGSGQLPSSADSVKDGKHVIAHLTGTDRFSFTEPQRNELRAFSDAGGILFIDAAGGSSLFANSAETELAHVFGDDAILGLKLPIPPEDPLYTIPGNMISSVTFRDFARTRLGYAIKRPRIFCVHHNGRVVAYFSHEDISAGIVGERMDGIDGYTPESATALVRNIVLSSLPRDAVVRKKLEPDYVGAWTPADMSTDYKTLEWRITANQLHNMSGIGFQYQAGAIRLNIKWVAVIVDGKEISRDSHFGYAGLPDSQNNYQLKISSEVQLKDECIIRASVSGDGGTDSTGRVMLLQAR